jgi:hypothetical protein
MALSSELLKPAQVAALLGVKIGTLAVWRCKGIGPEFIRIHRSVYYYARSIATWLKAQPVGAGEATPPKEVNHADNYGEILRV